MVSVEALVSGVESDFSCLNVIVEFLTNRNLIHSNPFELELQRISNGWIRSKSKGRGYLKEGYQERVELEQYNLITLISSLKAYGMDFQRRYPVEV